MPVAALGSILLHAAILSLPLGTGGALEHGYFLSSASRAIRATLRPLPPEAPAEEKAPAQTAPDALREEDRPAPKSGTPEPAGVVPLAVAYYEASQLTEIPRPLQEPPLELFRRGLSRPGEARLLMYIDESGRVTAVEVESATLSPAAVKRAVAIFGNVRFSPGRIGKVAVKTRVRMTVGAAEVPSEEGGGL